MNRWKLLVLLLVCSTGWGFSQVNLVPNGGFEQFSDCPFSLGQISKCMSWSFFDGSPDFYHECSGAEVSTPVNIFGYQEALDDGYIGVISYGYSCTGCQEIAYASLNQSLIQGEKYRVRMKVSFADSSNYAVCCIGVRLSSTPPPSPPFSQNWSSVELMIDSADFDTTNWFQLDELYTAQGGEDKIYLGTFRPESDLNPFIVGDTSNTNYNSAYFYIDDVEVYEDDLVSVNPNKASEFNLRTLTGSQLEVEVSESMNMTLLDVSGRAVLSERLLSGTSTLDVSKVPSGLYVAAFKNAAGMWVGSEKVVLVH